MAVMHIDKTRFSYFACLLLSVACMSAHGQMLAKDKPVKFLALGDSYTIGESVAELQRWPVQLIQALKADGYTCYSPETLAVTGWTTDDLKKALAGSALPKDYNLVSLLIGVNNQYQGKSAADYQTDFEALLDLAIQHGGGDHSRVFVLSIPDYGFTPFGQAQQAKTSAEIDAFNAINRSVSKKKSVTYIDITDISRLGLKDPALVAEDGLHPSGRMYRLWVSRILQSIR